MDSNNQQLPVIITPSTRFERLKNRFLARIYECTDPKGTVSAYAEILEVATTRDLTETDEKHLRQIQAAFKRFRPLLLLIKDGDPLHRAHTRLQALLRDRVRVNTPGYIDDAAWEKRTGLSPWQTDLVFRHAVTLQITTGCSNYCRRCNEWALPRVRGHFTRDTVLGFLEKLNARGNTDLALYGGSDPMDWHHDGATLPELLSTLDFPASYSLLTKIPKGRESVVKQTVENGLPLSVSLTNRNQARIHTLEQQLNRPFTKQHATADLLIPACLDEDFTSVKPSITDSYGTEISLDGAFIVIPTFTSALYPFGHKKIPVTRATRFFPVKKLGRPALLVDYFKPLEAADRHREKYCLDRLLDVQVDNILLDNGDYDLTPPGMRSVREYFEVFDEKARRQRQKNTLSVIKRLKRHALAQRPYKDLTGGERSAYRDKIKAHLDFTRKAVVADARVSAASFFLSAIRAHLAQAPEKQKILEFLTREEFHRRKAPSPDSVGKDLPELFSDPRQPAWDLFRYLALALVNGRHEQRVDGFTSQWPAAYHPGQDRFVRSERCHALR